MPVPLEALLPEVRVACTRLRDGLRALLGGELVALWAYGAATRPDHPKRLGDIDTHCLLRDRPDGATAARIEGLQEAIARDEKIEWDSWYILERDAHSSEPPRHVLREPTLMDASWSLHRAHWLADQYVPLHGPAPREIVPPPTWLELTDGLRSELEHIEQFIAEGHDEAGYCAYAVWNACRIVYSVENRDVVVSKRAAALWALDHMPAAWRPPIEAAARVYDDEEADEDARILKSSMPEIVAAARKLL